MSKLNTYLGVVQLFFTQSDPGFFLQFFLFFFGFCWGECAVHRLREADCSRSLTVFLRVSPPENGDNPSFLTSTESGRSLAENPGLRWTAWEAWPGFLSQPTIRGLLPWLEPAYRTCAATLIATSERVTVLVGGCVGCSGPPLPIFRH